MREKRRPRPNPPQTYDQGMSAPKIDLKDKFSAKTKKTKEWNEFSLPAKIGIIAAVVAELAAKVGVWTDLAKRPADKVRGPKWLWVVLSFINSFGPGAYFAIARKK